MTRKILVFDLVGKMAHFRKYFTNSSSLSYYFPPRTVVSGIIAGILGYQRDSYYKDFSKDKAFVGVGCKSKIKKLTQTINYILAKETSSLDLLLNPPTKPTQIPVEIITPIELDDNLIYRIYFYHLDNEIFIKLISFVQNEKFIFPPYLGITEFISNIKFVGLFDFEIQKETLPLLDSVLNLDFITNYGEGNLVTSKDLIYIKERMPFDFDENRRLSYEPKDFILEVKSGKIEIEFKNNKELPFIKLKDINENIYFMNHYEFLLSQG